MPVTSPPGSALPVLFLPHGEICFEFYAFLRQPRTRGKSGTWKRLHAQAVMLLYDYLVAREPSLELHRGPADSFVSDFVECLLFGTVQPDGGDPTRLWWRPRSWRRVREMLLAITRFRDFLLGDDATLAGASNPERIGWLRECFARDARKNNSMLAHLHTASSRPDFAAPLVPFERAFAHARHSGRPVPFPNRLEAPFFSSGILGRRKRNTTNGVCPHTLRDLLYYLLLLFGGLRKSEPLHLFLDDVHPDIETGQGATVFLYHPEHGGVPGERRTRADLLRARYGLVPRCRLAHTDPLFAGWKSLAMEEDVPGLGPRSRVYWLNPLAGQLFWEAHRYYLAHVRSRFQHHPYYFVNLSGDGYGRPMTIDAVDESFGRALRRLGLSASAAAGLSPHAMRHSYAQALTEANLRPQIIQICMHHRCLSSQNVYTRPWPHQISSALSIAEAKIQRGIKDFDPSGLGLHWNSDPLGIFGLVDPRVPSTVLRGSRVTNHLERTP